MRSATFTQAYAYVMTFSERGMNDACMLADLCEKLGSLNIYIKSYTTKRRTLLFTKESQ